MDKLELRSLALEFLRGNREAQYETLRTHLHSRSREGEFDFSRRDEGLLGEVLWDLSIERVITWGGRTNTEARWPFFYLTELGERLLTNGAPHYLDADGYVAFLGSLVEHPDEVVIQYAHEAARAFRSSLLFASAVMIGAAAERALLLLLEAVRDWHSDQRARSRVVKLLDRPRLPKILEEIRSAVERGVKMGLPYAMHQGTTEHLTSLVEMIRVQRNDAVHPQSGVVDRRKVYLTLQSFPAAYESIERLRSWFTENA